MSASLLWLGASALVLFAGAKYSGNKRLVESVNCLPGNSDIKIAPVNGAVVTCGVYGLFEHSGIWVDGNILELKGNGLIRAVSPKRFLQERSGDCIYIACNDNNTALIGAETADRALSRVFNYSEYDVIRNNCHKFVWDCISGEDVALTQFSALNQKMSERFGTNIYWHQLNTSQFY